MSHTVTAHVADGSLVCQHPDVEVERVLGRDLKWISEGDSCKAGRFFQQSYTANITTKEAAKLIAAKLDNINVKSKNRFLYPVWMTY